MVNVVWRQSVAMVLDAYRDLNAKRLFWITLVLSGLAVAVAGAIGINEKGLVLLFWDLEVPFANTHVIPRDVFYTQMLFKALGIDLWLAWIATILALISTAGIFPELITGGSIDLMLCRPIGRLRLFLTRYVTGLLFVTLQVGVFTLASFVVIAVRGGVWAPAIFLAVPLVVCFFSYLFGFCVLLGVWTRSTIAALLLSILIWFGLWIANTADDSILMFQAMQQETVAGYEQRVAETQQELEPSDGESSGGLLGAVMDALPRPGRMELEQQQQELANARGTLDTLDMIAGISYTVRTFLPKTAETVDLLDRVLPPLVINDPQSSESWPPQQRDGVNISNEAVSYRVVETRRSRSVAWVIGTSLLFEAVIVALAAWLFCRRDY